MIRSLFIKEKYRHFLINMLVKGLFESAEEADMWRGPYEWIPNDLQDIVETIKSCRSTCIFGSSSDGGFCTDWHLWSPHIHLI